MNKKVVYVLMGLIMLCIFVGLAIALVVFVVNSVNLNNRLNDANSQIQNLQEQLENEKTTPDVEDEENVTQTFVINPIYDEKTTTVFEYKANLPLAESNNPELLSDFNAYVRATLTDSSNEFASNIPPEEDGVTYTFDSDYEIIFQSEKSISIRVIETSYFGGAHPISEVKVINYNLETNEAITFETLFNTTSAFTTKLSTLSRNLLVDEFGVEMADQIESGTQTNLNNFAAFNFNADSFIINFQEYQVGPYAMGIPFVQFPWDEIESFVK